MLHIDSNNNISITRGDTGIFTISLVDKDGEPYIPAEGSSIRFAMSKKYGSTQGDLLIEKDIPIDTMTLELEPNDTKHLNFGSYLYDIQLTDEAGRVSTVVMANVKITKEVY